MTPYEGREPFIFVSYDHDDKDAVRAEVRRLTEQGWRVWYDEHIPAGTNWLKELGVRVRDSEALVLYLTEASCASDWLLAEAALAVEFGKRPVVVQLEAIEDLTRKYPWVNLALGRYQWLLKHQLDAPDYWAKLNADLPAGARGPAQVLPVDEQAHLVVRRCIVARRPGHRSWCPVDDHALLEAGSELRLLVQAEQGCHAMVEIDAVDRTSGRTSTTVLGPERLEPGIWHTFPRAASVLREDAPQDVGEWRIRLAASIVSKPTPGSRGLTLQGVERRRQFRFPLLPAMSFGLGEDVGGWSLEGSGTLVDAVTLRFALTDQTH